MKVFIGEDWIAKYCLCYLDGQDISLACYGADEEAGIAYCYAQNQEGRFFNGDDGDIVREDRYGHVELRIMDSAPEWAKAEFEWRIVSENDRTPD